MYFVHVRKPRSVHVSVLPFDDLPRTDIVEVGLRDRINQLTKEEKQKFEDKKETNQPKIR